MFVTADGTDRHGCRSEAARRFVHLDDDARHQRQDRRIENGRRLDVGCFETPAKKGTGYRVANAELSADLWTLTGRERRTRQSMH